MSTQTTTPQPVERDNATSDAMDAKTVLDGFATGRPIDPAVVARVRAQVEKIRNEIYQQRGFLDDETFQSLLDDDE